MDRGGGIIRLTMPLLPGAKLDGYEVLGLLGSGGMGEVYRARDPVLKREVAIKVLPSFVSQDPDRLRRFADSGGREILQIKLGDTKKPRSVITMAGDLNAGTVSPDGRKIIVSVGEEKSDIWLLKDFDPQTVRDQ
jgi:serine/threonine protein kinase